MIMIFCVSPGELGAGLHNLYNLTEIPILLYRYKLYIVKDPWIVTDCTNFLLILRLYYHPVLSQLTIL